MIKPVMAALVVWPVSLLDMAHVINGIDPLNSLLVAVAVTVFSIRLGIRQKNGGAKKRLTF